MRMARPILLVLLATAAGGCNGIGSPASPVGPTPAGASARGVQSGSVQGIDGFVQDTAFRPLAGVLVEVLDGPSAGQSTTSDASGRISLPGTFDSTMRFRASKDGYVTETQTWNCSVGVCPGARNARPWLGFRLGGLAVPVDIAGRYTVTFVADSACTDLPSEVRTRSYDATITPTPQPDTLAGTSFQVELGGAPFHPGFSSFYIGVFGSTLGIWLHGGHDPPIIEDLGDRKYLAYSGWASTSVDSQGDAPIATPFEGWIDFCELATPLGAIYSCGTSLVTGRPIPGAAVTYAHCESVNHRLVLTRR